MRKYFGTDGIRRIANTELSPELVYKVAKAGAYVLSKHTDHMPTILIGRDTRISGTLIESAMTAGFLSYGANVKILGVIPTPGVAYLTKKLKADASVVISASHNTYEFNGVKYFSNKGMKIPDELEEEIEEIMDSGKLDDFSAVNEKIGVSEIRTDLLDEYVYFFRKNFEEDFEELKEFVKKVRFDRMGAFAYSEEEGTFAAKEYEDSISHEVKQQRLDELMALQQEIAGELSQTKIGKEFKVIIDRKEGDYYIGRTQFDSPEVDPEVLIKADDEYLKIGEFYKVKITAADDFDLYASIL